MATAFVVAIALAVADIHIAGHGYGSRRREWITWVPGGVHLSPGDLIPLFTAGLNACLSWYFSGRD